MFFAKLFLILFVLFFIVFPVVIFAADSPDDFYDLALKDYKEGRYDEALREFSLVLLCKPDDQQTRFYINEIKQKDLPARNEKIKQALDKTEGFVEARASTKNNSVERQLNVSELKEARQK